jgi:hypothetical protein
MNTTQMNNIKEFFTDAEWDAIESALNDYADYGDEEANLVDSIQSKLSVLFN